MAMAGDEAEEVKATDRRSGLVGSILARIEAVLRNGFAGLGRARAGRRMEFEDSPPDAIAAAIASELGREVEYRPVTSDGAARAAAMIAEVL